MISRTWFARAIILVQLLLIGLCSQPCFAVQAVNIQKSPYDDRQYEGMYLDNGLRVLLVSDPSAEKAAAALNVEVGSYNDPVNRNGLAHFLEHMLFLGTDKYPDPAAFSNYISAHGGMQNAYTSNRNTQYYFDVLPSHLAGALDRFAQFFIAPQFNADLVNRERNAVDSEYKMHIQEDGWRISEVNGVTANPQHPIVQFSVGSLETLGVNDKDQTIRDDLIKFYQDYYSAERMVLVVVAPQSVQELQKLVLEYFSAVPKHPVKDNKIPVLAYTDKETNKQISVQTLGDYQELGLSFAIPSQRDKYASKSIEYILYMLRQSGPGSLYQLLRSKNLITSIYANHNDLTTLQDLASVGFSLTPDGMKNIDYIIGATFSYIEFLRKVGPQEAIFAELRMAGDRNFTYAAKESPVEYAGRLPDQVQIYPLEQVLTAAYFTKATTYNPKEIEDLLSYFTPQNMRVLILNKHIQGKLNEPFFNVNYKVEDFTAEQLQAWTMPSKNIEFTLPPSNTFMPSDLGVLSKNDESNLEEVPALIRDQAGVKLWHKQDHTFALPKVNLMFLFAAPDMQSTPKRQLLQSFMIFALSDHLTNLTSQFGLAGVDYVFSGNPMGVSLTVSMFSDQQQKVMYELIDYMQQNKIEPSRFKAYKDELKRDLLNFKQLPPYAQALQILDAISDKPSWLPSDLLPLIDKITIAEVEEYTNEFLSQIQIRSLIHGNMGDTAAVLLVNTVAEQLNVQAKDLEFNVAPKLIALKNGEKYYYQFDPMHRDATIVSYYQAPTADDKTIAVNAILVDMLHTKIFEQLRTQEQLGYLVQLAVMRVREQTGLAFLIESGNQKPEYLNKRLEEYLATYRGLLPQTSAQDLDTYKASLRAKLLQKPMSLGEESSRYWGKILDGSLRFDFNQSIASQVQTVTLEDITSYYNSIWFDPKTVRQIMVCSKGDKNPLSGARQIKSIAKFKGAAVFNN